MGSARIVAATGASMLLLLTGCATQSTAGSGAPTPVTASSAAAGASSATGTPRDGSTTASAASSPAVSQTPEMIMQSGTINTKVRELQARLRQLKFFTLYDLTDTYGAATAQAVSAFQDSVKLPANGSVDSTTWTKLQAATQAPTQAELDNQVPGPGVLDTTSADDVKDVQFRLAQVTSYKNGATGTWDDATAASVKEFQGKQGIPVDGVVDQRTLDRLTAATRAATPWELKGQTAPGASDGRQQVLDPRCMTGRVICASMTQKKVSWVVDGKTLATMDARYGQEPTFPTHRGEFHVYYKDANLVSRAFGNSPMPWSMCFDGDRCVHYSPDFITLGWGPTGTLGSHGCVNTRDWATMQWLFGQVQLGDTVIVY